MEPILEKYDLFRKEIVHGSLALFHGRGVMARVIQNCDKCYWNHIGIVLEINGALFIVDSNGNGVQADRLSYRISKYKGGDVGFIIPKIDKQIIDLSLNETLKRSDEKWIKYDFYNGGKELLNRKFNLNLKVNIDDYRDICSDYVGKHSVKTKMVYESEFNKLRVPFPEDYYRFRNKNFKYFLT